MHADVDGKADFAVVVAVDDEIVPEGDDQLIISGDAGGDLGQVAAAPAEPEALAAVFPGAEAADQRFIRQRDRPARRIVQTAVPPRRG